MPNKRRTRNMALQPGAARVRHTRHPANREGNSPDAERISPGFASQCRKRSCKNSMPPSSKSTRTHEAEISFVRKAKSGASQKRRTPTNPSHCTTQKGERGGNCRSSSRTAAPETPPGSAPAAIPDCSSRSRQDRTSLGQPPNTTCEVAPTAVACGRRRNKRHKKDPSPPTTTSRTNIDSSRSSLSSKPPYPTQRKKIPIKIFRQTNPKSLQKVHQNQKRKHRATQILWQGAVREQPG